VLLLLSVASVSRWKVSRVRAKRDASAYGRPHTRTRVMPGFIKNTRPYFLRRVASQPSRLPLRQPCSSIIVPHVRPRDKEKAASRANARLRRIRIDGRNFTRFWVTRRASVRPSGRRREGNFRRCDKWVGKEVNYCGRWTVNCKWRGIVVHGIPPPPSSPLRGKSMQ